MYHSRDKPRVINHPVWNCFRLAFKVCLGHCSYTARALSRDDVVQGIPAEILLQWHQVRVCASASRSLPGYAVLDTKDSPRSQEFAACHESQASERFQSCEVQNWSSKKSSAAVRTRTVACTTLATWSNSGEQAHEAGQGLMWRRAPCLPSCC